jgi:hypothetical protein
MMTSPIPECGGSWCPGLTMPAGRRFIADVDPPTISIILVSEAKPGGHSASLRAEPPAAAGPRAARLTPRSGQTYHPPDDERATP